MFGGVRTPAFFIVAACAGVLVGCGDGANGPQAGPGNSPTTGVPPEVVCQWAKVAHVVDGDTIRVDFEIGAADVPVRYIGIDTPETVAPGQAVQPFGPEATARNTRLVSGKRICLERDISEQDQYRRLLRYVWLEDGRLVNHVLLEEGLAVVDTFPPDVKYVERFTAAQAVARGSQRGIWSPR